MTQDVLGLASTWSADKIRSSRAAMRECLSGLADRGREVWTGPLDVLVEALATVARVDLCLARLVEGHCDALRILEQAGCEAQPGVYGVWASRSVGTGLTASQRDGRWRLSGELRFASGVGLIDRALVPGWVDEDTHLLLDVPADLGPADEDSWQTSAMDAARTFTLHVDTELSDAQAVGEANFYLDRPGFVVGGLCVAAVWAGGAQHVLDCVATSLRDFPATAHQLRRLGVMEQAAWQASSAIGCTVQRLGELSGDAAAREISVTRSCVVQACEAVIDESPRVIGPAGMSRNARMVRAVDDLGIYIRQHHLDKEFETLGAHALRSRERLAG